MSQSEDEPFIEKGFARFVEPVDEGLDTVIPEEDLVTLCLRVPCHVNLGWYNIVNDYKEQFAKQGRLQDKNETQARQLIMKGVRRHLSKWPSPYPDAAVQKQHKCEWRQRKMYNVHILEVWKYQEAKAAKEREQLRGPHDNADVVEVFESEDTNVVAVDVNSQFETEAKAAKEREQLGGPHDNADAVESQDSNVVANWVDVNSQSLTVNTESLCVNTESQSSNPTPKNSDVFYEDFDAFIPATSTQE